MFSICCLFAIFLLLLLQKEKKGMSSSEQSGAIDTLVVLQATLEAFTMALVMVAVSIYIVCKCLKCYVKFERRADGTKKRSFKATINDMSSPSNSSTTATPDSSPLREEEPDECDALV